MTDETQPPAAVPAPAHNGWRTFGIVVITAAVTLAVGYWVATTYLFPVSFKPVQLSATEEQRLDAKLQRIGVQRVRPAEPREPLVPERYSEGGASREIRFTQRELNALIANDPELATRLAIHLSRDLASAKLLIDLDPDFPVIGGRTLRVTAGMELGVRDGRLRAVLKGVSVWGVPLPNAWLGNLKNTDLVAEFGDAGGFWQAMRDGVESVDVRDGYLRVKLRE
jgi:hypothetical protein